MLPDDSITDIDDQILTDVVGIAKKKKAAGVMEGGDLEPAFASYLDQLVRFATGEDELWNEPEALLDRAINAWKNSASRKPGENKVALKTVGGKDWQSKRLVLDIVTEDKPFLVDSISAALSEAGKPVSFFSNVVIDVRRDDKGRRQPDGESESVRESMIHAEMDPPVSDDEIDRLRENISQVLADVSEAVADWEPMRARLAGAIAQLERSRLPGVSNEDQKEAIEFLKWLWDNRFAFLGVRCFTYSNKGGETRFEHQPENDLGILKDRKRRILKSTYRANGELSPAVEAFLQSGEPLIIAKANSRSLVHRRVHMDYIGVKTYSISGEVTGEIRFVGLFTAEAYNRPATDIPLVRAKVRSVIDRTAFLPGGHNEKALVNILETYPRDELFQIDVDTLCETSLGILRLYKRPRVKLFMRRDRFDRFVSALVFIPRDRFNSDVREEIGELLAASFDGRVSSFSPSFGDAALVRVHFIIGIDEGAPEGPGITALTRDVRTICRQWSDDLFDAMRSSHNGAPQIGLFAKYEKAFGGGYREHATIEETLSDIDSLEALTGDTSLIRAYRRDQDGDDIVRLKIYRRGGPLALSKLIPTIENLGLSVIQEAGYQVQPATDSGMWIHDFHTAQSFGKPIDLADVQSLFEETISCVLDGRTEDDGFNALVLTAGLSWREAWIMRAAARHHLQAGFSYSLAYIEEALNKNPEIARQLVSVFHARFNPDGPAKAAARRKEVEAVEEAVNALLEKVDSLDEDRIIRRYLNLFSATTRTNYFQTEKNGDHKPYISFKIDSAKVEDIPQPCPFREIFVSGPRVDGVHLRFGPVSRGGLRWSDRREDFRTEVLGLVKAQRVKNAVIVPNGSKGGFYPKQLPADGDRSAVYEEGREAYKLFIRGLLDLTDNIVKGKTVSPPDLVIWDDPDPYLVVAADKGTAQFSDTANAISTEYGFWLGDAFASGGSAGYDHKAMGITARGAWEAVKRHFRELGKDIQTEPFTVAGVGDMSGDVFGNGMLLSEKIRLIAAFDHRDIFVDPDPDPAKSFKERKRLFETPRSSWQDYSPKVLSKGGAVFSRSAKSLSVSPEIQNILNLEKPKVTPNQLIQAILRSQVELFWLGGIGTYFKAASEDNAHVGDRANDAIRINAQEMNFQVVGEGANLGLTQRARIEFARKGGKINTDAIDNSAGVDSSDHEVNIKILLSGAIEKAELKSEDRNDILAEMTDDVALHVLRNNYDQTRAISQIEVSAAEDLELHARFMSVLEREGRLDRKIEFLPDAEQVAEYRQRGLGLSRPELSVLLAYAKLWLFDELIDSEAPNDPMFESEVFAYFPERVRAFDQAIRAHQLRREIIATRLSNEIINTCGVTFPQRVTESTGVEFSTFALAYESARRIYDLTQFAQSVDALDNKAPASLQTKLYIEASNLLREQVYHLLSDAAARRTLTEKGLKPVIAKYKAPVQEFKSALTDILHADAADRMQQRYNFWIEEGAPESIAREASMIPALEHAFDIVDLAAKSGWSNPGVGGVFFAIGKIFGIDTVRLRSRAEPPVDHFDKVALRQLIEDLTTRQKTLCAQIIAAIKDEPKGAPSEWVDQAVSAWMKQEPDAVDQFIQATNALDLNGPISVGKASLFIRKLYELSQSASR